MMAFWLVSVLWTHKMNAITLEGDLLSETGDLCVIAKSNKPKYAK